MVEEFQQDGKWTVRIGDRVKVAGGVPVHYGEFFDQRVNGWTGTLLELRVEREGQVIARVTGPRSGCGVRHVNATRLTKTNVG